MISKYAHVVKTSGKQWVDCFRTAGQRQITLTILNRTDRLHDGDRATGTSGGVAETRTAQVVIACHLCTGRVGKPLVPPWPLARRYQLILQRPPLDHVIGVSHVGAD